MINFKIHFRIYFIFFVIIKCIDKKGDYKYEILLSYDEPPTINYCPSACDTKHGFYMCPDMMLFSDRMIQAAKEDENDKWAYYGIASHTNDKGDCCRCYQLHYTGYPGNHAKWLSLFFFGNYRVCHFFNTNRFKKIRNKNTKSQWTMVYTRRTIFL